MSQPHPSTRQLLPNQPERFGQDPYLAPFRDALARRIKAVQTMENRLTEGRRKLTEFASGHEYFGLHLRDGEWIFREWAPNAIAISLIGDFSNWQDDEGFRLHRLPGPTDQGIWEIRLPATRLKHGDLYRLRMQWPGGGGDRIPTYARRVVQDPHTLIFNAQIWQPAEPYRWRNPIPGQRTSAPLVYEAHVGMAQERETIGTYEEFRTGMLTRIADAGYNTIQLMAIMEHPYYGSFGYHVANFFAASSRFGTPDEFKALVDDAHGLGLRVVIDLIHSHAVRNDVEGLGHFDGTACQFFHDGPRGIHVAWDSCCFDYGKPEVLHFLLSNCRFWLDEYRLDGFRFDGITSMLYRDHGLGAAFTSYDQYFNDNVDEEALTYLNLANRVIHGVKPEATTIAEDVSGMPGLAVPSDEGGAGFDYRLAMGVTDYWFKLLDMRDEDWSMNGLWHELTNRRADERTISYVECHDQAIVGGQTFIYRMLGEAMYHAMHNGSQHLGVDRGLALHKMARLVTLATAGHGYLNFMGNEFGHPEWIDFPRQGNNWSYHHARRLWSLASRGDLRYRCLAVFDRAVLTLLEAGRLIESARPVRLFADDLAKILAFARGDLFFFFNFHPHESRPDFSVTAPAGEYTLILDSDAVEFGGGGRIQPGQTFQAMSDATGQATRHVLRLYLPSRSALVLKRQAPARS